MINNIFHAPHTCIIVNTGESFPMEKELKQAINDNWKLELLKNPNLI